MKRKELVYAVVLLTMLMTLLCSIKAMAAEKYIWNCDVRGVIESGCYTVYAKSIKSVSGIDVEGNLYAKGWFGIWRQVDSCSNSSNTEICEAKSNYELEDGKEYRLDYSATFYYTDGQSETLTGSTSN